MVPGSTRGRMTAMLVTVNIDMSDVADAGVDAPSFAAPHVRLAEDGSVVTTDQHTPTLSDGVGEVKLHPGPVEVSWRGFFRTCQVPDDAEAMSLADLLRPVLPPSPVTLTDLQALLIALTEERERVEALLDGAGGVVEGPPGLTPHIQGGTWWLGEEDTGVSATGQDGQDGVDGRDGRDGAPGASAFEVWLAAGNSGSEADFLASLKGSDGVDGQDGVDGRDGRDGAPGDPGTSGASAFDVWLAAGNSGSAADFLASLKGADGVDGKDGTTPHIENGNWWIGDTDTGVRAAGIDGVDGKDSTSGGIVIVGSEEEASALPIGTVYVIAPGATSGGIVIVGSEEEASALPIGTVYVIAPEATPSEPGTPEPGQVTIVGTAGENINTDTFTPTIPNATTGDTVIIAANTKAVGDSTITAPAGFITLVDGYWAGTQRSWVMSGPWSDDLTITADQPLEFAYAAVAVRGAASVATGTIKDRGTEPAESTTVTSPAVDRGINDLAIGIAFERTSATETDEQVTVNEGWTIEHYTAQGENFQTTLIGVGGVGDMVATYPNPQALNGTGVQVVAHA